MTGNLFLRMWPAVTIAILLVTELSFPFDPVRRWLARAPHLETNETGTEWRIANHDGSLAHPNTFPSRKAAAAHLRESDRVKAWLSDLTSCPFCIGAWLAAGMVGLVALLRSDADLLLWWPAVWTASAVTAFLVAKVMHE
jgi:hypothetical protein